MATLRLNTRQPVEEEVENWDDDDFMIDGDDIGLRTSSASTITASRRESQSSRLSMRSEMESLHGDEERQVHLPGNDEKSTLDAIETAARAGIPIPRNVPPSALMGGTIKRLGGRKVQRILNEDWDDDLVMPDGKPLHLKTQDASKFPEFLRHTSSSYPSQPKSSPALIQGDFTETTPKVLAAPINLARFRDTEDDDDVFGDGDGQATIKVSKIRHQAISLITPPTPQKKKTEDDDFEHDFDLPSDGKLKLSSRKDIPKTPSLTPMEDFDWGEGSLGTRFGGTRRDGRSNRSSSASALSPSVASSMTVESEDEAQLDGLVLPVGPVNFHERLRRRRQSRSPERIIEEEEPQQLPPTSAPLAEPEKADFFSDLDVGDGSVFNSGKLTLHRNIKVKETRPASPSRPKAAVSLIFTNKPVHASRLPRPMTTHHERTHTQSSLEPVSESGGPIIPRANKRSQSRLGHFSQSSQSSISSNPSPDNPSAPTAPSLTSPSTPRRREVGQKTSTISLRNDRNEPTTTSAQLLKLKRSLPAMKPPGSPARPSTAKGHERPPSRTDPVARPLSYLRPRTPLERTQLERNRHSLGDVAAAQPKKPFLPAGTSASSYNVNAKLPRAFRRNDSDHSIDLRPSSRAVSRSTVRSPSPVKRTRNVEKLAQAGARHPLGLPLRPRQFGDGHELDAFDDLPTSARAESEFIKEPREPISKFRNKVYLNMPTGRTNSPAPSSPYSPARFAHKPHFARDTASSRMAREASFSQHRVPSNGPLGPLAVQRVAQLSTRSNFHPLPPQSGVRSKKQSRKPPQLKPHLIANLNSAKESKGKFLSGHKNPCHQLLTCASCQWHVLQRRDVLLGG